MQLAKRRSRMSRRKYDAACVAIYERFADVANRHSQDADILRIQKRIERHDTELFVFLKNPDVPADNNQGERDIRSLATARSDGGVHRAEWSAKAFGQIKSVIRTCHKNTTNFLDYGLSLIRASQNGEATPLPLFSG